MTEKYSALPVVVALACFAFVTNLNWYAAREENKELLAELNRPVMTIAEFYDQNKNGLYDSYKLIRRFRDKSEEEIPNSLDTVYFFTPFGGPVREATRTQLDVACNDWGYLGVDKTRFVDKLALK